MASWRCVWRNFDLSEKLTQVCAEFQLSMSNSWIGGVSEGFGRIRGDSGVLAHQWLSQERRGVASAPAGMASRLRVVTAECRRSEPCVLCFSVLCCVCRFACVRLLPACLNWIYFTIRASCYVVSLCLVNWLALYFLFV